MNKTKELYLALLVLFEMTSLNLYKSFRFLDISTLNDDIIVIKYTNQIKIDTEEVQQLIDTIFLLYDSGFNKLISDARSPQLIITKDALDLFAKHTDELLMEVKHAIVVIHPAMRLLAGFYLKFSKPTIPTQTFSKIKDAIKWVRVK